MNDWEQIVKGHASLVWTTAFRLLNHREDAADCTQETFLAALAIARKEPVRKCHSFLTPFTLSTRPRLLGNDSRPLVVPPSAPTTLPSSLIAGVRRGI